MLPQIVLVFALSVVVKIDVTESFRVAVLIVHLEICYNTTQVFLQNQI